MVKEKFGIGTKHITKEGYEIEIVEKLENDKRRVRFENGYEVVGEISSIRRGQIKNPYHLSVFGVGYFGVGKYRAKINGKHTPEYVTWVNMLERCYSKKYQERCPTYKAVTVCNKWLNFQNFADFYNDNYSKIEGIKFQLDKDLLQENMKNKIYSPETCVFLPQSVNSFLTNKHSDNTSGYTGVSWDKRGKKWRADITAFGQNASIYLGVFFTPELASEAYQKAREIESEKVKSYLRNLNYLPENIIQLIK